MRVRWSDVDLFGHVNNGAFLRYLDDARFALFPNMGVDASGAMTASLLVVVKHEIDYVSPLTFRQQPFVVSVWVPRIGTSSVDFAYEIMDEGSAGTTYLRARSRMVQLDHASRAPRAFTAEERAAFEQFCGDVPQLHAF
ncbi:acyl-CoA thioesterase [Rarobacter incanus]|uniref:Acyl-CoA thioester hydrolase n=1 Tax=Rarobacter incanus TaxID=153494 RepID=A0A542SN28_9MICO|nr:acyl-CoA thioester hydrolase [Rarobacter incanus]